MSRGHRRAKKRAVKTELTTHDADHPPLHPARRLPAFTGLLLIARRHGWRSRQDRLPFVPPPSIIAPATLKLGENGIRSSRTGWHWDDQRQTTGLAALPAPRETSAAVPHPALRHGLPRRSPADAKAQQAEPSARRERPRTSACSCFEPSRGITSPQKMIPRRNETRSARLPKQLAVRRLLVSYFVPSLVQSPRTPQQGNK